MHRLDAEPDFAERLVEGEPDTEVAEEAVVEALCAVGVDGRWLARAIPCNWPRTILAVAAADLIDHRPFMVLTASWQQGDGQFSY